MHSGVLAEVSAVLNPCKLCGGRPSVHSRAFLALFPVSLGKEKVTAFLLAIRDFDVAHLRSYYDFDMMADALAVYLVKCPLDKFQTIAVRDPVAYSENPEIYVSFEVSGDRLARARPHLAGIVWEPIGC